MQTSLRAFWRAMRLLYEDLFLFVAASLAWWAGVLLVLPAAPATAALNHLAYERAHGRRASFSDFWDAGKHYFWRSWLIALIDIIGFIILGVNTLFYRQSPAPALHVIAVVWLIVLIWWSVGNLYLFPFLVGLTRPTPWLVFRSAMLMPLARPLATFSLVLFALSLTVICSALVVLAFFILPAALAVLSHVFFHDLIAEIMPDAGATSSLKNDI